LPTVRACEVSTPAASVTRHAATTTPHRLIGRW
jgi:hypothetical protein